MKQSAIGLSSLKRVPNAVWLLGGGLSLLGFLTPNPGLTVAAAGLLIWFFLLLWRPGEPPILLLALGVQWLQVVIKIFQADLMNIPVSELNEFGGDLIKAIWLSMVALAVLALGMRIAIGRYKAANIELARSEAMFLLPSRLWLTYLVFFAVSFGLLSLAWAVPGITQIAIALANIKWAAYFMLAFVCFMRPERLYLLLIAFGIELVFSMGAYFSSFRTVFFVSILAFLASGRKLTGKQIAVLLPIVSILIIMSMAWTAIKIEYRDYLNEGQAKQIITRGYAERVQKLFDMVSELKKENMTDAQLDMVRRISYVDIFGRVLVMVPRARAHEEGELWGAALQHIFMPRLFFPDKSMLRGDTENTNFFTGLKFAGEEVGTSVSIGYVAESYIDFGQYGMFAPILGLGFLWGGMYRYFLSRPRSPLIIGYGLAVVVLMGAMLFEANNVKLLGGVVTGFLVAFIVEKFFSRKLVRKLMPRRPGVHGLGPYPQGMPVEDRARKLVGRIR